MNSRLNRQRDQDHRNDAYYEGRQRLKQLGLAVPPELQIFETVVNWPRMYVDELVRRQNVKTVYRPGTSGLDGGTPDTALQEAFEANNLDAEIGMLNSETRIFGRCYIAVGANEDDAEHPLITVESPRQMSCLVDQRRRRMEAAFRQYRTENGERVGTLFLPDRTLQLIAGPRGWQIDQVGSDTGVDEHGLGRVPVVLTLNRRRLGRWHGTSEMADVIPLTDSCARTLSNLGVAQETHAVPQKWVLGMSKGDFVDKNGNPIPVWESYYTAIWANQKKPGDMSVGQFTASDLRNFHETVKLYAELASSVTGLPVRYFGQNTINPAAEGAIRADESRIIGNAEAANRHQGVALGWALALYERFRTGRWLPAGERIAVEWRNPATPTKAEEADAIQKLNGGTAVLSREGSWDEMGWDEARKNRERDYFAAEEADPVLARAAANLNGSPATGAPQAGDGVPASGA